MNQQFKRENVVPPGALRVLQAILQLNEQHVPVTWRKLIEVLGIRSTNGIKNSIKTLKHHGLIDSEGSGRVSPGTLRATCYFKTLPSLDDKAEVLPPQKEEEDEG